MDIPPLYVYYLVEENPNKIVYIGLSPAWGQSDLVPPWPSQRATTLIESASIEP